MTVLITVIVLMSLFTLLATSVTNEMRGGKNIKVRNELVQAADGVSEQARSKLLADYLASNKSVANFLSDLTLQQSVGVSGLGAGMQGAWWAAAKSGSSDLYGWVDVHATVRRGDESQTVIRRVSFGEQDQFKLAMLSETTNCMYCHLRVNGDVGSLEHLRPGWGSEVAASMHSSGCWVNGEDKCDLGWGSGGHEGGSRVNGTVYAAKTVTDDDTNLSGSTKRINGAEVTGQILTNYRGSELPKDTNGDGVADFPPIKRAKATANANGSLSGGTMMLVANASSPITGVSDNRANVSGVVDGNLVLIGTPTDPIVLDRDVYVTGDVVIKGAVTGRGAIYAGRNLYVAGNIVSQNAPDKPGLGVCSGTSDPDACARNNIAAGKDEIRLAARGNTVVGDYTERDASGNLLPWDKLQSADFYRNQFYFNSWNGSRYYDRNTGDELSLRGGTYYNVEGTVVPGSQVITRASNRGGSTYDANADAYSYSFRPGSIDASNGNFRSWMSDSFYRNNLLGSQNFAYNTWRWSLSRGSGESQSAYFSRIVAGLTDSRATAPVPTDAAQGIACTIAGYARNDRPTGGGYRCPNPDARGNIVSGSNNWGWFNWDGYNLRVAVDGARNWETQVNEIDAFLYSNWRIAGKTSMNAFSINGGLIAKELGILAPGRRAAWWMGEDNGADRTEGNSDDNYDTRYDFLYDASKACGSQAAAQYRVSDSENCALTVNYDHRLRNGGYGFGLVEGNPGQTISWRLSDRSSDKVTW